jgi:hypothetical protein
MTLSRLLLMAVVVVATVIVFALPALAQTDQYYDDRIDASAPYEGGLNVPTCSIVPLPPSWSWWYICDDGSMTPWSW